VWLSQLALVNFRNFASLRLEPNPGVLLFYGRNGQGKTNLLESVYVLATTRSPRTSIERELVSWCTPDDPALAEVVAPFARLEARVRRTEADVHLELTLEAERLVNESPSATPSGRPISSSVKSGRGQIGGVTRSIKVNGLPVRASGLVGQLPVVYFSPADVDLAGGSPSGRRQYLNLANSQASPAHMRALQRYNRVLLQRNQTLRLIREHRQPLSALEPWTEQLIDLGALILRQRVAMLADLDTRVKSIFHDLSGSTDSLSIAYRSTVFSEPTPEAAELVVAFRDRQSQVAQREVDQAVSLVGPHRDDFAFLLDDVDLNVYGSRGQQRLAVLALKLAEADWMRAEIGELPVVLLDDVLSELDPQRRGYVMQRVVTAEALNQRQVWITTTDADDVALAGLNHHGFLDSAQRYQIDAGRLRPA
jgi:DNA replication and repair protein RecF